MHRSRWRFTLLLAVVLIVTTAASAMAGGATDRLRSFFADVNRLLAEPSYDGRPDERLAALRALVTDVVDFRNAAAVALGAEWAARSPAERDEFVAMFTDLLETSTFASVGARARLDHGLTVTYADEVAEGGTSLVPTTVLTRSDREMSVAYRMADRDGRWAVQDVVVDGVSLVENYRAQFQKVIQRSSYAGLVGEMRARLGDLGRPVVAAAPAPLVTPAIVAARPALERGVTSPMLTMRTLRDADDVARVAAPAPPRVVVASAVPPVARPTEVAVNAIRVRETTPGLASGERYWVQVGAFRSPERAIQVATALRDQTISVFAAPDTPWLRVVVGPFASRDAAASKLREIRARGYEAFISEATN